MWLQVQWGLWGVYVPNMERTVPDPLGVRARRLLVQRRRGALVASDHIGDAAVSPCGEIRAEESAAQAVEEVVRVLDPFPAGEVGESEVCQRRVGVR